MSKELTLVSTVQQQLAIAGKTVTPAEDKILSAQSALKIRKMDADQVRSELSNVMRFVSIDLGIRSGADDFDRKYMEARFLQIVTSYFPDLTVSEIKIAFEMLIVGELDEYLPKNSDGSPRREHYQYFNADFVSRVLNAYRKRKNALNGKITLLLPEKPIEQSAEEIAAINQNYRKFIESILTKLCAGEPVPSYELTDYLYQMIIDANKIERGSPTQQEIESAKEKIRTDLSISTWIRSEIDLQNKALGVSPRVMALAQSDARIRLIKEAIFNQPKRVKQTLKFYDNRNSSGN